MLATKLSFLVSDFLYLVFIRKWTCLLTHKCQVNANFVCKSFFMLERYFEKKGIWTKKNLAPKKKYCSLFISEQCANWITLLYYKLFSSSYRHDTLDPLKPRTIKCHVQALRPKFVPSGQKQDIFQIRGKGSKNFKEKNSKIACNIVKEFNYHIVYRRMEHNFFFAPEYYSKLSMLLSQQQKIWNIITKPIIWCYH